MTITITVIITIIATINWDEVMRFFFLKWSLPIRMNGCEVQ